MVVGNQPIFYCRCSKFFYRVNVFIFCALGRCIYLRLWFLFERSAAIGQQINDNPTASLMWDAENKSRLLHDLLWEYWSSFVYFKMGRCSFCVFSKKRVDLTAASAGNQIGHITRQRNMKEQIRTKESRWLLHTSLPFSLCSRSSFRFSSVSLVVRGAKCSKRPAFFLKEGRKEKKHLFVASAEPPR